MPRKRRIARRLSTQQQLVAWTELFETGHDFFGEASELSGVPEPRGMPPGPQGAAAEAAWRAACGEAWLRLGTLFLANYDGPRPTWAEAEFGEP